jgi:hypothetical protein
MERYLNQEHVLRLIEKAVEHSGQLGGSYKSDLLSDFVRAQQALVTSADIKSQLALVVSAARMMIAQAEKKTIQLIIGDAPVTGQQMSHLVRIRLICAELIGLLSNTLEWIKQPAAKRLSA